MNLEQYLDQQIKALKLRLHEKKLKLDYKFLGDSIVYKEDKYLKIIPRQGYLNIAKKVKELHDLEKTLEIK